MGIIASYVMWTLPLGGGNINGKAVGRVGFDLFRKGAVSAPRMEARAGLKGSASWLAGA